MQPHEVVREDVEGVAEPGEGQAQPVRQVGEPHHAGGAVERVQKPAQPQHCARSIDR